MSEKENKIQLQAEEIAKLRIELKLKDAIVFNLLVATTKSKTVLAPDLIKVVQAMYGIKFTDAGVVDFSDEEEVNEITEVQEQIDEGTKKRESEIEPKNKDEEKSNVVDFGRYKKERENRKEKN